MDKKFLGVFGDIHPAYAKKFDLKKSVVYAELKLDQLFETRGTRMKFVPLERYPAVSRDIAVVTDRETSAQQITNTINKAGGKLLRNVEIFDIYEGEHVEVGKKSVALRVTYQAADHTLKEEEISTVHKAILEALAKKLNAELRA
jgi:phenylalanyl-tRNA synthetase beta chain